MIAVGALQLRVAVTVLVLVLSASFVSVAEAKTSCAYAGPPANVLTVKLTDSYAVIERMGLQIVAGEAAELAQPCAGGTPTVLNTDSIIVRSRDGSHVDVRLGGGPLGPGATAETQGAAEIEIYLVGVGSGGIVGTSAGDEFHWGPGGALAGLNLNPRSNDQDVDVTINGGLLMAEGRGGNDTIIAQPGVLIRDVVFSTGGPGNDLLGVPDRTRGILEGGPGNDVIIGSRYGDLLEGGSGNDLVGGFAGADDINGGRGKDRLSGGAGRDIIDARDTERDVVSCGTGRDRANADRRDRLRGCERTAR
jgi:Ca2+-binding RTX toxin-like protein